MPGCPDKEMSGCISTHVESLACIYTLTCRMCIYSKKKFVHTVKCFNESLSMDSIHLFTLMTCLHGANFVLVSRFFLKGDYMLWMCSRTPHLQL